MTKRATRGMLAGLLFLGLAGCQAPDPIPEDCPPEGWCWVRGAWHGLTVDRGQVLALGMQGRVAVWQGDGWRQLRAPTPALITSAVAGPGGQVWALDVNGQPWAFDGRSWSVLASNRNLKTLLGAADGSLWGLEWSSDKSQQRFAPPLLRRGDGWVEVASLPPLCTRSSYLPVSERELWVAGFTCDAEGRLLTQELHRWTGASWERTAQGVTGSSALELSEGAPTFGNLRWDGQAWRELALAAPTVPAVLGCWTVARAGREHWCEGRGQVYRWDGERWRPTLEDPLTAARAALPWGALPPEVWARADHAWGSGPSDVYRAWWDLGFVERFDGTAWRPAWPRTLTVRQLAGSERGEPWVRAQEGLFRAQGGELVEVPLPEGETEEQLVHVQPLGGDAAWVVSRSAVYRLEGSRWTRLRDAAGPGGFFDAASPGGDVLVVAEHGPDPMTGNAFWLRRLDAAGWSEEGLPGSEGLRLRAAQGAVWLVHGDTVRRLPSGAPLGDAPFPGAPWTDGTSLWVVDGWRVAVHR